MEGEGDFFEQYSSRLIASDKSDIVKIRKTFQPMTNEDHDFILVGLSSSHAVKIAHPPPL